MKAHVGHTHRSWGTMLNLLSYSAGTAHRHHEPTRRIGIGEVAVSRQPLLLDTVLGSCVAVCLYDPIARSGGMNHILIPSSHSDCSGTARCGVQAMELLINALMRIGADRRRLAAKAFGAANTLPVFQTPTIGDLNAKFVRGFLATEGIPLLAERMGGDRAVRVAFQTHSGRAFVHTLDGSRLPETVREEISYYHTEARGRFPSEETTLF